MMKTFRFLLRQWKLWTCLFLGGLLALVGAVRFSRAAVAKSSEGRVFSTVADLPASEVALVLGCAREFQGRENLYFKYRIAAVKELWDAGRVEHILVSGDNSRKDYDEPSDMKEALMAEGIPAERIHCDYAGFRTLDSVIRAHEVFLLERFVVVSQRFHVERALYLAHELGIEAYGFPAKDVGGKGGRRTKAREELARVKAVLDMKVFKTKPKFLGEPVPILSSAGDR